MADKPRRSAGSRSFGITRLEIVVAAVVAAVMLVLVIVEPAIAEAPFENGRTILFTGGGTVLAAIAFVVMLRLRVPPVARVVLLIVPFLVVNWWLISPYFIDDVVDEEFSTSIAEQLESPADASPATTATGSTASEPAGGEPAESGEASPTTAPPSTDPPAPTGPVLPPRR